MVWWIASWAEDEQLQGKNSLLRRGVLVLGELVVKGDLNDPPAGLDLSPLRWWLVLFIEALVLLPNIEWEGIQQWRDLKGDSQYMLS